MVRRNQQFDPQSFLSQASDALKELARNPNIKQYSPHEKQYHFHKSPKDRKLYIGGNRSGKTTAGVCEGIWRALGKHPYRPELNNLGPTRGRVIGVDFTQGIDKIIIPQYKQWVYPSALLGGSWDTAYDKGSRVLNFANRSTIEFMSYDQDLDKFAGTSRHWIHFDEEPPRTIWVENLARLIDTEGEFWITMTPVEGMTWVYDDLYEQNVNNKDGNVEVIEISSFDNPYLSGKALESFASVVNDDDANVRIGGAFVQQGGKIYKNFDPTRGAAQVLTHEQSATILEDANAFFPKRNWLWVMSMDWGLKNPTAVEWTAINEYGFAVTFDEHYQADLVVKDQANKIKEKIARHKRWPDILIADPSIKNRNGVTGESIQLAFMKEGLPFQLGNNEIKAGLVRVKKYFNQRPLNAGAEFRAHPLFPEPGREYYGLYISAACEKLIWELKRYRWKTFVNKKLAEQRNPYDEPNPKDDHACDALRYGLMSQPDLFADPANLGSKMEQIMKELDVKIGTATDPFSDYADPNELLRPERDWMPGNSVPKEFHSTWDFDEHMGGLM